MQARAAGGRRLIFAVGLVLAALLGSKISDWQTQTEVSAGRGLSGREPGGTHGADAGLSSSSSVCCPLWRCVVRALSLATTG